MNILEYTLRKLIYRYTKKYKLINNPSYSDGFSFFQILYDSNNPSEQKAIPIQYSIMEPIINKDESISMKERRCEIDNHGGCYRIGFSWYKKDIQQGMFFAFDKSNYNFKEGQVWGKSGIIKYYWYYLKIKLLLFINKQLFRYYNFLVDNFNYNIYKDDTTNILYTFLYWVIIFSFFNPFIIILFIYFIFFL